LVIHGQTTSLQAEESMALCMVRVRGTNGLILLSGGMAGVARTVIRRSIAANVFGIEGKQNSFEGVTLFWVILASFLKMSSSKLKTEFSNATCFLVSEEHHEIY